MIELSEQQIIEELTDRLANVYAGVQMDQVSQIVGEEYARFRGRPIREFIPLFVERNAKVALASLVRLGGWLPVGLECVERRIGHRGDCLHRVGGGAIVAYGPRQDALTCGQ